MEAYPFSSAGAEAVIECSTERVRRLYTIPTPKNGYLVSDCVKPLLNKAYTSSYTSAPKSHTLKVVRFATLGIRNYKILIQYSPIALSLSNVVKLASV
jgi:Ulp1 family protease